MAFWASHIGLSVLDSAEQAERLRGLCFDRREHKRRTAMTDPDTTDRRVAGLMQAAQAGSAEAYVQLLHEITPRIRRIVRRRHGRGSGTEDVEDLVQDILLSVHAVRATYDPQRPFMPWLIAITRNRVHGDGSCRVGGWLLVHLAGSRRHCSSRCPHGVGGFRPATATLRDRGFCDLASSDHVRHVGRARRIAEEHGLEVCRREVAAHGHREEVDDFLSVRAQDLRAQHAPGDLLNQDLEA